MYSQHLFSFVLFSGLLLTTANRCPEDRDIEPYCTCTDNHAPPIPKLHCQLIFHVEVLQKLFSATGDHPLHSLELTGSYMSSFPASALKEKRVKQLFLQGVNLVGLFDRVPEPNHILTTLHIRERSKIFRGMEWPLLKNFNNLTSLVIEGVTIRSLGEEFMDNVPRSLTQFVLVNNKLSRLNDRVFARITELTSLTIINATIDTLKRSMFPVENVIETLDFKDNRISELPDDIFSDMPYLNRLSLENNLLTTISEPVFKEISGIYVNLHGNNIKCDCKVRWILKSEWNMLLGKCHSPNNFKDKDLRGGITNEDLEYCDDV